ncbi:MAG: hypothetical protein N2578_03430, partial [Bdellovibrionaceae bacterium]|nr:hypothetical protein [Pseudobdellovibrionaceae bacterium]
MQSTVESKTLSPSDGVMGRLSRVLFSPWKEFRDRPQKRFRSQLCYLGASLAEELFKSVPDSERNLALVSEAVEILHA